MIKKGILIAALISVAQMFEYVQAAPLVRDISENDNSLQEQAFLKSQYEVFQNKVMPIYYISPRGYNYDKPKVPFESGYVDSGEVVDVFEGYVYNTPNTPFTLPPPTKTTTEFSLPPASARTLI